MVYEHRDSPGTTMEHGPDRRRRSHHCSVWRVRVRGALDATSAPHLDEILELVMRRPVALVVLDLTGVTFADSSGLRVIVRARAELARHDRQLAVVGCSPAAERVLEISGLLNGLETRRRWARRGPADRRALRAPALR